MTPEKMRSYCGVFLSLFVYAALMAFAYFTYEIIIDFKDDLLDEIDLDGLGLGDLNLDDLSLGDLYGDLGACST